MRQRPVNFSAGPAILPESVLAEASEGVVALKDLGLSILEISHRSPTFEHIIAETRERLRALLNVPETHDILFLQGGARGQFAQVPLNFLKTGTTAAFIDTGTWSAGAIAEAARLGQTSVLASSAAQSYAGLPDLQGLRLPDDCAYVHSTSNNTIYGTQWADLPTFEGVANVCDMSSDILSRPIDVSQFSLIYAGAQKNAGPAGVTLVIIDKAWMADAREDIPVIWRYQTQAAKASMYNTPPVFPIYVVGLVARWLEEMGGLNAIEAHNRDKAALLYAAIEGSSGFYSSTVSDPCARSLMNVTWRIADTQLEPLFVQQALECGLSGVKGHRKVGGLRASIYNAMPRSGVEKLVEFMADFARRHAGT